MSAINSIFYTDGHPAGFSDDLGIIADRNQWMDAQKPGWYVFMRYDKDVPHSRVIKWCKSNLTGPWEHTGNFGLYIANDDDATLFKLRWID